MSRLLKPGGAMSLHKLEPFAAPNCTTLHSPFWGELHTSHLRGSFRPLSRIGRIGRISVSLATPPLSML